MRARLDLYRNADLIDFPALNRVLNLLNIAGMGSNSAYAVAGPALAAGGGEMTDKQQALMLAVMLAADERRYMQEGAFDAARESRLSRERLNRNYNLRVKGPYDDEAEGAGEESS